MIYRKWSTRRVDFWWRRAKGSTRRHRERRKKGKDKGLCRMQNLASYRHPGQLFVTNTSDVAVYLDPNLNPKCTECQSMDIDQMYKKIFGCLVCKKCQNEKPEKYSLLTKTECKEVRRFPGALPYADITTTSGLSPDRSYVKLVQVINVSP